MPKAINHPIKRGRMIYYNNNDINDGKIYDAKVINIKETKYRGKLGREYKLRILKNKKDNNGRPTQSELEFYLFEPNNSISALALAFPDNE